MNSTVERPAARRTIYQIKDGEGRLVAKHHRVDKPDGTKTVWWEKDGESGLNGAPLADLPLYGSELVGTLCEDELIVVTEGEKARDALKEAGIPAVGTITGASGTPGEGTLEVLRDRRVALWPDADDAGREHMKRIAQRLHGVAAEVIFYTWHEAPNDVKGADAADHPAVRNKAPKALDRLLTDLEGAPRWELEGAVSEFEQVGVLLSNVKAERVEWLWERRIPKGKLTLVDGDPGKGKSALTVWIAACVTIGGAFPDGAECEPGGVVLMNAEDGLADTIRPRLDAAGGDPSKVISLASVPDGDGHERTLSIPEDIPIIERCIRWVKAALVVIDPLMAFLSSNANAHKDQDVRKALAPLAAMAERTGAAVVVVRHLNKATGGNALYRGGGSIGIVGAARSALVVAEDPEDDERRVLASLKNNLSGASSSLAFTVESAENGAARVEWRGKTELKADQLLNAPADDEEKSALAEAKDFLRDVLGDGPISAKQIKKEAREADVSDSTLKRAKKVLKVESDKESDGSWTWSLPSEGKGVKEGYAKDVELLGPLDPPEGPSLRRPSESANRAIEDRGDQGDQEDQGSRVEVSRSPYPGRTAAKGNGEYTRVKGVL